MANYTEIKTSVTNFSARDDLVAQIPDFIAFGESRISRDMRLRNMETALNETMSGGIITVPSDYLDLKHAYIDRSPTQWLERVTPEKIYRKYPVRSGGNTPFYIAREGTSFIFGPYPDTDYTVKGIYYAKPTALSDANPTNWFSENADDLVIYAALLELSVYVVNDTDIAKYEALYTNRKKEIKDENDKEEYSGSVLRTWAG